MKYSYIVTSQIKIKTGWKAAPATEYIVRVPNHMSINPEKLLNAVKNKIDQMLPGKNASITSHCLYSDTTLTYNEKTQLDLNGSIVTPVVDIPLEELEYK